MSAVRRILLVALLLFVPLLLAACQGGSRDADFVWQPLYGDGSNDTTPVVARVAGVEITEQDIDLRLDELPDNAKSRYQGAEGRRLLLKDMIDTVLMARGAVDRELYNERNVARTLISQRRVTLDMAMRGPGLLAHAQPTEQDLRDWFLSHRDKYRQLGSVQARHVECRTREDAQKAYDRLRRDGPKDKFPYVVHDLSVNEATKKKDGELGWFNKGGFIPDVPNSARFATLAFDLKDGLNPPIEIDGRWHVVEIERREQPRPMTFAEARDKVMEDLKPSFQEGVITDYLAEARQKYPPEMLGDYAPGHGLTPEQIVARAMAMPDNQQKIDLLLMVITDFPQSDRVDDAEFLVAQVYIDVWGDYRAASRYLTMLVKDHPESEYVDDAQYMLDNLDNPAALNPKKIEDLRK